MSSTTSLSTSFSSMSSPSSNTSTSTSSTSSTSISNSTSTTPPPPPPPPSSTSSSTSIISISSFTSSTSSSQTTSTFTSTPEPPSATSAAPSLSNTSAVPIITTQGPTPNTNPAPAVITSTSLSIGTDGKVVTVTQIFPNPTLSPNNVSTNNSAFFRNTAAVAGVFILVGLAAASIILWVFFAIRSRRRTQRLDHDTAVSATLAAAGFRRTPLDDDDDPAESSRRSRYGSPDALLHQRRSSSGLAMSSVPSARRISSAFIDALPSHDDNDLHDFNPYSDYIVPAGPRDGYISSPPTSAFVPGPYRNRCSSNTMGQNITGHAPQHSGGSREPLLSAYNHNSLPPSPTGVTPSPQRLSPKNPLALSDKPQQSSGVLEASVASSVYSSESTGDHRLDPNLRQRLQDDADSFRDLRDEEDYSRPVLGVRNLPDATSLASVR